MGLIHSDKFSEGEIFCKWLRSRLIVNNKNVLSAELGPTGSGKSYRDLRKAELWYKYHFKEDFPVENICFGLSSGMKLISSGKLRRGEIIIMEEAGVNLGSRDFAHRVSKLFNYVLQSFRSMNIGIFFNLPYLSMLDSQARHLIHFYAESVGIDFKTKLNICKPFFTQTAQSSGKMYRHYPIIKLNGVSLKIKRFAYSMPSQYLIDAYEQKKAEYLAKLTKDISKEMDEHENGKKPIRIPKEAEFEAFRLYKAGKKPQEIADLLNISLKSQYEYRKRVEEYLKLKETKGK
jgi:hypothetical protein